MLNLQISANIKTLCKNKNVPVKKLLEDCKLTKSLIYDLEKRSISPSCEKIKRIADYLECSIDFLMGRVEKEDELYKAKSKKIHIIENNTPKPKQTTVLLPLYDEPASAGTGNWLESDTPMHYITVLKDEHTKRTDFLIRVSGDSMIPKFSDGDIVCVQKTPAIDEGEIGIFIVNGDSYIKKMGNFELVSINPAYDNISLLDTDSVMCSGRVLGIAQIV